MSTLKSIYTLTDKPQDKFEEYADIFLAFHPDFPQDYDSDLDEVQSTMVALYWQIFDLRTVAEHLLGCQKVLSEKEEHGQLITKYQFEQIQESVTSEARSKVEKYMNKRR